MPLMIDTVEVHIPILPMFAKKTSDTGWVIVGDVADYDLKPASRYVSKQDDGTKVPFELYHMQESLPTSHTGIGFKFMHKTNNCLPHVILNCSIAKILQGHNVFGSLDMIAGTLEMLGVFKSTYPDFASYLDFSNTEISRFDVTLPMQTQSLLTAERIRDYLRNVDWGRYRNLSVRNVKHHYNTLYFGSPKSKLGGFKIYCKGVELEDFVRQLNKKAKKGCLTSQYRLKNVYTDDVIDYAQKSVRAEATVKKRMMKEQYLPTNLWEFLYYQVNNKHIYRRLFNIKTKDFFKALEGLSVTFKDNTEIYDLLHQKLTTTTPTGRISTTRAKHAYRFYKEIRDDGFYEVKRTTDERTFRRNVKSLVDAGISRAHLQNLSKNEETQILRLLNLDFDAPLPKSYKPPVTTYFNEFAQYFEPYKRA